MQRAALAPHHRFTGNDFVQGSPLPTFYHTEHPPAMVNRPADTGRNGGEIIDRYKHINHEKQRA